MIPYNELQYHLRRRKRQIGVNKDTLFYLKQVSSLVLIGSSCTGKSTLIDTLQKSIPVESGLIDVPLRYITRSRRFGDRDSENIFVSENKFKEMQRSGEIGLAWERSLHGPNTLYGFPPKKTGSVLTVYSANNDLYHQREKLCGKDMLFMEVMAPLDARIQRMLQRSPDLSEEEIAARLRDHPFIIQETNEAMDFIPCVGDAFPWSSDYPFYMPKGFFDTRYQGHLRMYNFGNYESSSSKSFVDFVEKLANILEAA